MKKHIIEEEKLRNFIKPDINYVAITTDSNFAEVEEWLKENNYNNITIKRVDEEFPGISDQIFIVEDVEKPIKIIYEPDEYSWNFDKDGTHMQRKLTESEVKRFAKALEDGIIELTEVK